MHEFWASPQLLVAALGLAVAVIGWLVRQQFAMMVARLSAIEATLLDVDRRLPSFATAEQLNNVAERFDRRVSELRERVSVIEARVNDFREKRRHERPSYHSSGADE